MDAVRDMELAIFCLAPFCKLIPVSFIIAICCPWNCSITIRPLIFLGMTIDAILAKQGLFIS